MRIVTVILIALLATATVGCMAEQEEPTPDRQAIAKAWGEATKQAERNAGATVEAKAKRDLQVQEALKAIWEAAEGESTPTPAPTSTPHPTQTPYLTSAQYPTPGPYPTPTVFQQPTPTISPEEIRPTGNPTPAPYSTTGEECDQLLRNQLAYQTGATNAGRMQEVIRQIQVQRGECGTGAWRPTVDDANWTGVNGCWSAGNQTERRNNPMVGNIPVPDGLFDGVDLTSQVRPRSGRDSENNVIVYWSHQPGQTTSAGAACWMYDSQLNVWDENQVSEPPATQRIVWSLADGEEPKEGDWQYVEVDEGNIHAKLIIMVTPEDDMITTYGCSTIKDLDFTEPIVKIRFPHRLPMDLITQEYSLQVQTTVEGNSLPVEWETSLTQATDIKMTGADAQFFVQTIEFTDTKQYQITFANHPELDRTIPSANLGSALFETGTDCFSGEIKEQVVDLPMPPAIHQNPVDGLYRYTSPTGRFTFQYPADCGQMWESSNAAENFRTCTGDRQEIDVSVEEINLQGAAAKTSESPEWLAKDQSDNLAAGFKDTARYNLVTNDGNKLEVAKIRIDTPEGPATTLAATFVDAEWHLIIIYVAYWSETEEINEKRAEASLKTFSAKHP